jgi:hypothetical protein
MKVVRGAKADASKQRWTRRAAVDEERRAERRKGCPWRPSPDRLLRAGGMVAARPPPLLSPLRPAFAGIFDTFALSAAPFQKAVI